MDLAKQRIFRLKGTIQPYAWGGKEFIPHLLGIAPGDSPAAEYWLGAHASAPSLVENGQETVRLDQLVDSHPQETIGAQVSNAFGRLPYLLKILDVKDMLSIQVHPSRVAAEQGFAAENAAGMPLNDPRRNYKDDNHKPELAAALGDFWLLHGFKGSHQLQEILRSVPELAELYPIFEQGGYERLYSHVMRMPQEEVNRLLQPLLDRIIPLYREGRLQRPQEDFWAARAALTYERPGIIDRGIFSIYLLNLVQLKPGEAIFQDAGILHAYLEGQNVEIMANSDNVLRGGLTVKNIDVDELMKHVSFEAVDPWIIQGAGNGERVYKTPADDFELSCFHLQAGGMASFETNTADIIIATGGRVRLEGGGEGMELAKGQSAIIFPGHGVTVGAMEEATLFRATVPVNNGE